MALTSRASPIIALGLCRTAFTAPSRMSPRDNGRRGMIPGRWADIRLALAGRCRRGPTGAPDGGGGCTGPGATGRPGAPGPPRAGTRRRVVAVRRHLRAPLVRVLGPIIAHDGAGVCATAPSAGGAPTERGRAGGGEPGDAAAGHREGSGATWSAAGAVTSGTAFHCEKCRVPGLLGRAVDAQQVVPGVGGHGHAGAVAADALGQDVGRRPSTVAGATAALSMSTCPSSCSVNTRSRRLARVSPGP